MDSILDFIQVPIGWALKFCNTIVGNQYIFALLIFAVLVEILMIPFAIKQQKNSIKQASLRPKEMAIRKKYAGRDDAQTKQKVQEEIQALYQKEGFNPMGGCLPLLIQFPVLIILYNIVINPLKYICGLSADAITHAAEIVVSIKPELIAEKSTAAKTVASLAGTNTINLMAHVKDILAADPDAFAAVADFADKIPDASALPNLTYFGVNLGLTPSITSLTSDNKLQAILLIVPVATFLVYFFSSKLTRKLTYQPTTADDPQMGCSNKMMDIMMPLFSVYITFITPAAIGIYWIFKSILGIVKQLIMKKAMPLPVFTEEDYKAAEKEVNSRIDKSNKIEKSGKVVRSLHHIDDEDFDDTREAALKRKEALAAQEAANEAAKAQNNSPFASLFGGASVKKDEKKKDKKVKDADKKADGETTIGPEGKADEQSDDNNK